MNLIVINCVSNLTILSIYQERAMEKGFIQDDILGEAMKVAKLGYEKLLSALNSVINKVVSKEDDCIENIKFLTTAINNHPVFDIS